MSGINLHDPNFRYPQGVGYKVYAFQFGGTTTPVSTYADPAGETPNEWPVILADAGNGVDADNPGDGIAPIFVTVNVTIDIRDGDDVSQAGYPSHFIRGSTLADLQAVDDRLSGRLDGHDDALYLLQSRATLLESRVTDLESRATDLEGRATDLEGRATDLEGRATDLEGRATAVEGRATDLEGRATDLEGRATAVEGRATDLEGRATDLEGRATDLEGRATALEAWRAIDEPAIDTLQTQMGTTIDNVVDLLARMGTAEGDIGTLQDQVGSIQGAISGLAAAEGGTYYSWDKESDTLQCWGTFTTASNGTASISFPVSYDVLIAVIPVCIWSGSAFVAAKLTATSTTGFSLYAGIIDNSGVHPDTINGVWNAIGKKAG